MRRWTQPQAVVMKSLANRLIVAATICHRAEKDAVIRGEFEADLHFATKMKSEAEGALRRGLGIWKCV